MKKPIAIWINIFFRVLVSFAYAGLGYYVAFFSEYQLGFMMGIPTVYLLGVLFMIYGAFRLVRAFIYFKENDHINEEDANDEYGKYES
ncbi:hypothetical protein V7S76_00910 [Aquirufa sp. ROCK2-A2]